MELDRDTSWSTRGATPRRTFLIASAGAAGALLLGALDVAHAAPTGMIVGDISGVGQFEILSYSWNSSINSKPGGAISKADGVSFTKYVDGVSATLSAMVARGDGVASASMTVDGKGASRLSYVMTDVLMAGYTLGPTTPTGDATELVTLRFASMKTVRR